jgi:hypothetical protein
VKLARSRLTYCSNTSKLVTVVFARSILVPVLIVALVAYAVDCSPTVTAEQALQCCSSMRCMSHQHRGRECCKTMPTTQVAIGQRTSVSISFAVVFVAIVQALSESVAVTASPRLIAGQSHAPPELSLASILPLRI